MSRILFPRRPDASRSAKSFVVPAALRHWWAALNVRERRLVVLGGAVVVAAILWSLAIRPAIDSLRHHRELLPRLQAQAAEIDGLILQAQDLQRRRSGRVLETDIPAALRDSLMRNGIDPSTITVTRAAADTAGSDTWEVIIGSAGADALMKWLAVLPALLNVQVDAVELHRGQENGRDLPGKVTGRVVLQTGQGQSERGQDS